MAFLFPWSIRMNTVIRVSSIIESEIGLITGSKPG
jgi:hypothetical protein